MPWPPPSTLPDTPFPNRAVAAVAAVASALLTPAYWALDRLLALQPTTAQRARWRRHRGRRWLGVGARVAAAPVLVLALVLALPPALLGLLLWLPAQAERRPFVHQHAATTATAPPWDPRRPRGFTFVTANVCLLPSGLARFSNLGGTRRRAEAIAGILAPPTEPSGDRAALLEPRRGQRGGYGGTLGTKVSRTDPRTATEPGPVHPTSALEMLAANSSSVVSPTLMVSSPSMDSPTPMVTPPSMTNPTLMVNSPSVTNPPSMVSPPLMVSSPSMDSPTLMVNSPLMTTPPPMTTPRPAADLLPTPELPMTTPTPAPAPSPATAPWPERPLPLPDPMPAVLSAHIPPDADFVCLQEVFDATAATVLRRGLGRRFAHVLWGVGPAGLRRGRLRALGSGLVLGSRFPLPAARFHAFPNGAREDALATKGLLVAQVLLGTGRGRRVVGYLGCTHLQAPACDATIRDAQLSLILRWLQDFRREQERPGDLVAFEVLCGDLNFDNCSRGDAQNQRHPLFREFWDPARLRPGQDQPWAIGTLLDCLKIYEEPVSTPEKMKRTLSEPWGRERFLAGPILSSGALDPTAPRPWQGRRVDLALLRPEPGVTTEVTGLSVITQLATLSDHLPVALRLRLGPADH